MKRRRGFTLLEVMVAIAILGVASAGLVTVVSRNVRYTGHLEDRTIALWIANNRITEMRATQAFPATGRATEKLEYADREWQLAIEGKATSYASMRSVEVGVGPRPGFGEDFSSLVTLTGYLVERGAEP